MITPGKRLREALQVEVPLQIVGTINAYCALMAEASAYKCIYVSGAGVANAAHALPDLGMTNLHDVSEEVRRISAAVDLPILVDIDTGWGSAFNIARSIKQMQAAGAAAVHIEDQVLAKRCGHRPGKAMVSCSEMCDRIKAAVDARSDSDFMIMARTDAYASEGMSAAIDRAKAYLEAGADAIFPEAITKLEEYAQLSQAVAAPILANMTEFGKTELFDLQALKDHGVAMVLYPLSAFRAMNAAALKVYQTIRANGQQRDVVDCMQTREELYEFLNYYAYERKLDQLFNQDKE